MCVPWPNFKVKKRLYRFRVRNASISRGYRLQLSDGTPLKVIGTDGGLMPAPQPTAQLRLGMAERYEFVVDFARYATGQKVELRNLGVPNSTDFDNTGKVLQFEVVDGTFDPTNDDVPARLNTNQDVMGRTEAQSVGTVRVGTDVARVPNYGPDDDRNKSCNDPVDADPRSSGGGAAVSRGRPLRRRRPWHGGGVSSPRDRDPEGRARNARPRDAAGRPLPRGAVGVDRVPDDLVLSPEETVVEAQRLLDAGRPFSAHEVLEAAWKAAGPAERELWRGLAQLAVGLTHLQRGNARGAVALLRRGVEHVTHWRAGSIGPPPAELDLDGLVGHAEALADRVARDGSAVTTPADLGPRLRP